MLMILVPPPVIVQVQLAQPGVSLGSFRLWHFQSVGAAYVQEQFGVGHQNSASGVSGTSSRPTAIE